MADEEKVQVNAGLMPVELVEQLDAMVEEDESDRSKFIRKLIRNEWQRRQIANPMAGNRPAPKSKRAGQTVAA